jgi:hypothetical protein
MERAEDVVADMLSDPSLSLLPQHANARWTLDGFSSTSARNLEKIPPSAFGPRSPTAVTGRFTNQRLLLGHRFLYSRRISASTTTRQMDECAKCRWSEPWVENESFQRGKRSGGFCWKAIQTRYRQLQLPKYRDQFRRVLLSRYLLAHLLNFMHGCLSIYSANLQRPGVAPDAALCAAVRDEVRTSLPVVRHK